MAIENLSVAEKLLLMERLWNELSCRPANIPSPDWHGRVLADREAAVRDGQTPCVEWGVARERLRERLK